MIKHFGFRLTIFSNTLILLFFTFFHHTQEVVKCLVEAGARIDQARGDDRRSPLHMAVQHGQLEVVRFLLQVLLLLQPKQRGGWKKFYLAAVHAPSNR